MGDVVLKVYAFEICSCKYESGWSVQELFASKRDAARAMYRWLYADVLSSQNLRRQIGRQRGGLYGWRGDKYSSVPSVDMWRVKEYELN